MKTKNKIILTSLYTVILFAFSCREKCHIDLVKPADVKPIDSESYNDVYNVFWNYFEEYYRGAWSLTDSIKTYGKIDTCTLDTSHSFVLISEHEYEHNIIYDFIQEYRLYPGPAINVFCHSIADELQSKLDSCDLTGRCYIKGELKIGAVGGHGGINGPDDCHFTFPHIFLKNINDIYFENEKNNDDE
ncbi:MAG: hypothetical protein LBV26_05910 [Bacteroidales bacterium]|nr:hypothetical protein [Bacteroidales bacterium]